MNVRERDVTSEERKTFKEALMEKARLDLGQQSVFEAALAHGFSTKLVSAVTADCEHIFTVDYLTDNFRIFNIEHAVTILEYIHEIFEDIPAIIELSEMFPLLTLLPRPWSWYNMIYLTLKKLKVPNPTG